MIRPHLRKALLVSTLALTALTAFSGSAGAQPAPDDDPDYSHPMWIYANPATRVDDGLTFDGIAVDAGLIHPVEPPREPQPDWADQEQFDVSR